MDSCRRRLLAVCAVAGVLAVTRAPSAQTRDPDGALKELKEGFALKQLGRLDEALPHLQNSVRLDPTPRGLLNLADCEEGLHKLVDASTHWAAARDVAVAQGSTAFRDEAQSRLAALQARLPRLTLRLAPSAPPGTVVLRDGIVVPADSLGQPVAADPAMHVIVVHAEGRTDTEVDVPLAEGEQKDVVVDAGGPAPVATTPTAPPTSSPGATSAALPAAVPPPPASSPAATASSPPVPAIRVAGYVVGGAGLLGIVAGSITGGLALAKKSDFTAHCDGSTKLCDQEGLSAVADAKSFALASTIGFVAGGAALATGAVLFFLGGRVTPVAAPGAAGLIFTGRFE
jgi:hypothetical protein